MKTKISLLLLCAAFMFSFTTEKSNSNDRFSNLENIEITLDNISGLEDNASTFFMDIIWTGPATYGSPNYLQVRAATNTFYEDFYGKGIFSAITGDNSARWAFNGTSNRGSVEGAMSKDGTVEPDDGD